MMNYEVLYILSADSSDETKENLIKKFEEEVTAGGGSVEKIDKWGTRKLAYPINYKNEGYYVLMNFSAANHIPAELQRVMKIQDEVMRYMIVKKES